MRAYLQPATHHWLSDKPLLTEADFNPYQHWMSNTMQTKSAVLLGAFMGAGKTATALHAFTENMKKKGWKKALIIAPKAVATDTWPDELLNWDFTKDLTYTVLVGDEQTLYTRMAKDVNIYIVNRERVEWLAKHNTSEWFANFNVIIYDEASRLKSAQPRTKPSKKYPEGNVTAFACLVDIRKKIKNCWLLSGTPAPNGVKDLWGPIFMLDNGERFGFRKEMFLQNHFDYNPYSYTYKPKPYAEENIMEKVKDIMFVLKEEDYIELPPVHVIDRYVRLEDNIMKKYKRFVKERILPEYNTEAVNAAVLASKLLQFSNGSVYETLDETDPNYDPKQKPEAKYVHDRKLLELDSVFAENPGQSILIAYSYKFDIYAIKKKFPFVRAFGETINDVKDWNSGKIKAMAIHPQSAGHGLNLQHGGSIAVWFGLTWGLEFYLQFNKRLHRRGQQHSVKMYRILSKDTYDEKQAEVLKSEKCLLKMNY